MLENKFKIKSKFAPAGDPAPILGAKYMARFLSRSKWRLPARTASSIEGAAVRRTRFARQNRVKIEAGRELVS